MVVHLRNGTYLHCIEDIPYGDCTRQIGMATLQDQYKIDGNIRLNPVDIGVIEQRIGQYGVLVLPSASTHKKQKIVIGGSDGHISCSTISNTFSLENTWRTNTTISKSVVCLAVGGLKQVKDQIYGVCGNSIVGLRKAGAIFFKFANPIPDLQNVLVDQTYLHCFSRNSYSLFNQTTLVYSHTFSSDIISHCLVPLYPNAAAVVCCADGAIRVLTPPFMDHNDTQIIAETRPQATPKTITSGLGCSIVCGSATGEVACYALSRSPESAPAAGEQPPSTSTAGWTLRETWRSSLPWLGGGGPGAPTCVVQDGGSARVLSEVSALTVGALLECLPVAARDSAKISAEVVVGTVDGTLSILRVPCDCWNATAERAAPSESIKPVFEAVLAEGVAGLHVGHLASSEVMDVLAVTRGGRMSVYSTAAKSASHGLLALDAFPTTDGNQFTRLLQRLQGDKEGLPLTGPEARRVGELSVKRMQDDLVRLRTQMVDLKDALTKAAGGRIASKQPLGLTLRVLPLPDSNVFRLVLESEVPLDIVTFTATRRVTIEPTDQQLCILTVQPQREQQRPTHGLTDADMFPTRRSAPVPTSQFGSAEYIASFRCAVQVRKVECRLRANEGAACELRAFAVMKTDPVRCQTVSTTLQPLCLHQPIPVEQAARTLGTNTYARVGIRGDFSAQQAQLWFAKLFTAVPQQRVGDANALQEVAYSSALDHSVLVISYGQGRMDVHAESLYTCQVLREMLIKCLADDRVRTNINVVLRKDSVLSALKRSQTLLHPALVAPQQLEMAAALRELQAHEPELLTFLDPTLALLLEDEESTRAAVRAALVEKDLVISSLMGLFDAVYIMKGRIVDLTLRQKLESLLQSSNYVPSRLDEIFAEALSSWTS